MVGTMARKIKIALLGIFIFPPDNYVLHKQIIAYFFLFCNSQKTIFPDIQKDSLQ